MAALRNDRIRAGWVGFLFLAFTATVSIARADVLFPVALHLTREISDPISGVSIVEEYCHANRIVSIAGGRTVIADYESRTVTEIDFQNSTYSLTTFEAIAGAREAMAKPRNEIRHEDWRIERRGSRTIASKDGDAFEARRDSEFGGEKVIVTADRKVILSAPAVEALMGVGYPNPQSDVDAVVMRVLRDETHAGNGRQAALPLETRIRVEGEGEALEIRNVVVRVGSELAPVERLTIPIGARRIESRSVAAQRLLREIDQRRPAAQ